MFFSEPSHDQGLLDTAKRYVDYNYRSARIPSRITKTNMVRFLVGQFYGNDTRLPLVDSIYRDMKLRYMSNHDLAATNGEVMYVGNNLLTEEFYLNSLGIPKHYVPKLMVLIFNAVAFHEASHCAIAKDNIDFVTTNHTELRNTYARYNDWLCDTYSTRRYAVEMDDFVDGSGLIYSTYVLNHHLGIDVFDDDYTVQKNMLLAVAINVVEDVYIEKFYAKNQDRRAGMVFDFFGRIFFGKYSFNNVYEQDPSMISLVHFYRNPDNDFNYHLRSNFANLSALYAELDRITPHTNIIGRTELAYNIYKIMLQMAEEYEESCGAGTDDKEDDDAENNDDSINNDDSDSSSNTERDKDSNGDSDDETDDEHDDESGNSEGDSEDDSEDSSEDNSEDDPENSSEDGSEDSSGNESEDSPSNSNPLQDLIDAIAKAMNNELTGEDSNSLANNSDIYSEVERPEDFNDDGQEESLTEKIKSQFNKSNVEIEYARERLWEEIEFLDAFTDESKLIDISELAGEENGNRGVESDPEFFQSLSPLAGYLKYARGGERPTLRGLVRGRFDPNRLSNKHTGRVFRQKIDVRDSRDTPQVITLLDVSGSTRGYSWSSRKGGNVYLLKEIVDFGYSIYKVLHQNGIPNSCYCHTTNSGYNGYASALFGIASSGMPFDGHESVTTPNVEDRFRYAVEKIYNMGNADGFATREVVKSFNHGIKNQKLLITVSDGLPSVSSSLSLSPSGDLLAAIQESRENGVSIIAVAVVEDVYSSLCELYGEDFVVKGWEDMSHAANIVINAIKM